MVTHERLMRGVTLPGLLGLALSIASFCAVTAAADDSTNSAIVRWAKGTYEYGKVDSDLKRGHEDWTLNRASRRHPHRAGLCESARGWAIKRNAILRVDTDFRPLESVVSFWRSGAFGGTGWYRVEGRTLSASVAGPRGQASHRTEVPERFSLRVHPVITRGLAGVDSRSLGQGAAAGLAL